MKLFKLLPLLILLPFSCSKCDDEDMPICENTAASADVQFEKTSEKCSDVDLLWEVRFAVAVQFEIDISCNPDCDGQLIRYNIDEKLKTSEGVLEFGNSINSFAYYQCNNKSTRTQTFNTPADENDPTAFEYQIGDTLWFSYSNPNKCLSQDLFDCAFESEPIDLPDFTFEYIITEDDFDCD